MERYENGKDLRRATYFSQNDNGNYISVRGGKSQYKCSFRTGELYLNAAEAAARLGKLPEARERLLQLVKNRYTQAGYEEKAKAAEAMGQEELVQEILDERMRELAFEGHYWFDLRRTSRPRIEKGNRRQIVCAGGERLALYAAHSPRRHRCQSGTSELNVFPLKSRTSLFRGAT